MEITMSRIFIVGGSRGIGAACVRRFSHAGNSVAFTYLHSAERSRALASECGAAAIECDVCSSDSVADALSEALGALGGIDVLVCSAGIAHFSLAQDIPDSELWRVIDTDLCGTFRVCRAVIPHMVANQSGRIVTLSSMWGEVGSSCESAYSAAKGGVIALTKALAKELGPSHITVNCVSPGVIDTEMNAALSADDLALLADETPLGRIGTSDEAAAVVEFLASDSASFVTGQVIGVSGGLVM